MQQIKTMNIEELEILKQELEETQKDYEELNERIFKKDYSDHYELQFLREEMNEDWFKIQMLNSEIKVLELK